MQIIVMEKTSFKIEKMDCPSEEQIIRMKLADLESIRSLEFDISKRMLHVIHSGTNEIIFKRLEELKFNASIFSSITIKETEPSGDRLQERKILRIVLAINLSFFAIEMISGIVSWSMGLLADSLDMLADAVVYGMALVAVGGSVSKKKNIAKYAGLFQMILATLGFIEVFRRFFGFERIPEFHTMIFVSAGALIANGICLFLLQKSKSKEAHIQASMIFTSNDVIINAGVIIAGIIVYLSDSNLPDLIIGTLVFGIVMRGAVRILRLSK